MGQRSTLTNPHETMSVVMQGYIMWASIARGVRGVSHVRYLDSEPSIDFLSAAHRQHSRSQAAPKPVESLSTDAAPPSAPSHGLRLCMSPAHTAWMHAEAWLRRLQNARMRMGMMLSNCVFWCISLDVRCVVRVTTRPLIYIYIIP